MKTSRAIPLLLISIIVAWTTTPSAATERPQVEANHVVEFTLRTDRSYDDPFNEIDVDAIFTDPNGREVRVPAFWAGGHEWRVRYASNVLGVHRFRTECTDQDNTKLHGETGEVEIIPYQGDNPLYQHGPICVADNKRHFEHADGTPFLWLADTWWMGLCERLGWPEDFRTLAADRKEKSFNVVQIVAGLYPDMPAFDPRGANEAGFPWEKDYARIRPEYFDAADERLMELVDQGFVPCIVGAWGYHLPWMGEERMKQHWRYLVARYGALPVVWCVAGEVNLPYYLEPGFPQGGEKQTERWIGITRYVNEINGLDRLVTLHPTGLPPYSARGLLADDSLIDFDMLQTGHGLRDGLPATIGAMRASYAAEPLMPVINAEVSYEALLGRIPAEIPRLMFWTCMMSGAAGHSYGANGIWQVNQVDQPYGKSPHGGNYGTIPWPEAMNLAGSKQIGLGKQLLERYPWHRFEPHPEWVSWDDEKSLSGAWIWYPEGEPATDAPVETRYFRRTFTLPEDQGEVRSAVAQVTADDECELFVNGKTAGAHGSWRSVARFDIKKLLKPGENVLAVRATNRPAPVVQNPAGLLCEICIEFSEGKALSIPSDGSWEVARQVEDGWQAAGFDVGDWSPARVVAKQGAGPWIQDARQKEFEQPLAAGVPDGVRLVYVLDPRPIVVHGLEADARYQALHFDPVTGESGEIGEITANPEGSWRCPAPETDHDWVLILEPK